MDMNITLVKDSTPSKNQEDDLFFQFTHIEDATKDLVRLVKLSVKDFRNNHPSEFSKGDIINLPNKEYIKTQALAKLFKMVIDTRISTLNAVDVARIQQKAEIQKESAILQRMKELKTQEKLREENEYRQEWTEAKLDPNKLPAFVRKWKLYNGGPDHLKADDKS